MHSAALVAVLTLPWCIYVHLRVSILTFTLFHTVSPLMCIV